MKRRTSSSTRAHGGAASSPSPGTYRGRVAPFDSALGTNAAGDIDLTVSHNAVAAAAADEHTQRKVGSLFQGAFASMREIVWDYHDKSVVFTMADGRVSGTFMIPALRQLEVHILAVLADVDTLHQPKQAYVGVLVGEYPSSPIQQRRRVASSGSTTGLASTTGRSTDQLLQSMVLAGTKRRELLQQERPLRGAASRERLAIAFFRAGYLSFSCSISGDRRGLKLDASFLSVFPSPDCHDRSACLFLYPYDSLETCRAEQTRLEFRFKRAGGSGAVKQPTYLVFQSREAQDIREAVWFLKYGTYREVSARGRSAQVVQAAVVAAATSPSEPASEQARKLTRAADDDALSQRIDSRCRMIGCLRECESAASAKSSSSSLGNSSIALTSHQSQQPTSTATTVRAASSTTIRAGLGCLCDKHAAMLCGSPPKTSSKLKRGGSSGFFSHKDRSSKTIAHAMVSLVQAGHFARTLKFHGALLKKPGSGGKYQVKKAWSLKVAVAIETPVGGFLCYYDKLSHCPGMTDAPKERRVIDLSSVLCIRPESLFSSAVAASGSFAFDVITLYRTWTFAATDADEYDAWLHVLTELVEKHVAVAPDKPLRYPVRLALSSIGSRPATRMEEAVLEVSAHGLCVINTTSNAVTGSSGSPVGSGDQLLLTWYFTDVQKWSVVAHQGEKCCLLSCLSSADKDTTASDQRPPLSSALSSPAHPTTSRASAASSGSGRSESFLLQTAEAGDICDAIDFYVGKCMAKLEVLTIEFMERYTKERQAASADNDSIGVKRVPSANSMLAEARREPVERSKSERVVSKMAVAGGDGASPTLAKLFVSAPKAKDEALTKEHAMRVVSLAPLAAPDASVALDRTRASVKVVEVPAEAARPRVEADDTAPVGDERSSVCEDELSVKHEPPVATVEIETRSLASLGLPIELDMIELELLKGNAVGPDAAAALCEVLISIDGGSGLGSAVDLRRCDSEDAAGGEEREREPSLCAVDEQEANMPLLGPASPQTRLHLDELGDGLVVSTAALDLSVVLDLREEDGASEDGSRQDEGGEEDELDRFESFEYCVCHVDE